MSYSNPNIFVFVFLYDVIYIFSDNFFGFLYLGKFGKKGGSRRDPTLAKVWTEYIRYHNLAWNLFCVILFSFLNILDKNYNKLKMDVGIKKAHCHLNRRTKLKRQRSSSLVVC